LTITCGGEHATAPVSIDPRLDIPDLNDGRQTLADVINVAKKKAMNEKSKSLKTTKGKKKMTGSSRMA